MCFFNINFLKYGNTLSQISVLKILTLDNAFGLKDYSSNGQ
jgi:hypothetical protein